MRRNRSRPLLVALLLLVIATGLASRAYGASLPGFLASHAGDALWTVAVYLSLALLMPGAPALALGLSAFGISVVVELSQLLDYAWLGELRSTRLGQLLLGSGFLAVDLVRYLAGAALATVVDRSGPSGRGATT